MARRKSAGSAGIAGIATIVGFVIGVIALVLQLTVFEDAGPALENVLNWCVGIGLVGGIISLTAMSLQKVRGRRR